MQDSDGRSCGAGDVGEIVVRGESGLTLFAGYLDMPDVTTASFRDGWFLHRRPRPARRRRPLLLRRPPVAMCSRWRARTSRSSRSRRCIAEHPKVLEVAVVGRPDAIRDEVPVAFVVARDPDDPPATRRARRVVRATGWRRPSGPREITLLTNCRAPASARSASSCCETARPMPRRRNIRMTISVRRSARLVRGVDGTGRRSARPAAGHLHERRVPGVREAVAVRPRMAVRRVAQSHPESRRLLHVHHQRRAVASSCGARIESCRVPVGRVPAPRHAGRRRQRQLHHVQMPVSPLDLRPRRPAARRARRWSARVGFDKKDFRAAVATRRGVAGLRLRQLRPRRRAARARRSRRYDAVPRTLRPRRRGLPGHLHAARPAVELEGHVRELQRRLPRQPAAPVRSRTSARATLAAFPVPWDDASNVIFRTNGYTHIDGGFNATHQGADAGLPEAHRGGALAVDVRADAADAVLRHRARPGVLLHRPPEDREHHRRRDRLPVPPERARAPDVRPPARDERRRRAGLRAPGPGRHHQGAARACQSRFAARGRYSWQEESHVQFNRWLVQRYRRHWPRVAGPA